jgi:hypothetical protein
MLTVWLWVGKNQLSFPRGLAKKEFHGLHVEKMEL